MWCGRSSAGGRRQLRKKVVASGLGPAWVFRATRKATTSGDQRDMALSHILAHHRSLSPTRVLPDPELAKRLPGCLLTPYLPRY
jgi:hypothetical protein